MNGLTTDLLGRACRTFLELAYPGGESTIPEQRRPFLRLSPDQPLAAVLERRDVCQTLLHPGGSVRGYALRLGSTRFPHLKLQVIALDNAASWVFTVDTHDTLKCTLTPAETEEWGRIQNENRKLKDRIERAWEGQGLLTFNAILRRGLEQNGAPPGVDCRS
jgi:hypothetical protein